MSNVNRQELACPSCVLAQASLDIAIGAFGIWTLAHAEALSRGTPCPTCRCDCYLIPEGLGGALQAMAEAMAQLNIDKVRRWRCGRHPPTS